MEKKGEEKTLLNSNRQMINKPDRATMRPGFVSMCIDHVTYMYGQTDGRTDGWKDSQNMLIDHLFQ